MAFIFALIQWHSNMHVAFQSVCKLTSPVIVVITPLGKTVLAVDTKDLNRFRK